MSLLFLPLPLLACLPACFLSIYLSVQATVYAHCPFHSVCLFQVDLYVVLLCSLFSVPLNVPLKAPIPHVFWFSSLLMLLSYY